MCGCLPVFLCVYRCRCGFNKPEGWGGSQSQETRPHTVPEMHALCNNQRCNKLKPHKKKEEEEQEEEEEEEQEEEKEEERVNNCV